MGWRGMCGDAAWASEEGLLADDIRDEGSSDNARGANERARWDASMTFTCKDGSVRGWCSQFGPSKARERGTEWTVAAAASLLGNVGSRPSEPSLPATPMYCFYVTLASAHHSCGRSNGISFG